jgi:hypothetical protein
MVAPGGMSRCAERATAHDRFPPRGSPAASRTRATHETVGGLDPPTALATARSCVRQLLLPRLLARPPYDARGARWSSTRPRRA